PHLGGTCPSPAAAQSTAARATGGIRGKRTTYGAADSADATDAAAAYRLPLPPLRQPAFERGGILQKLLRRVVLDKLNRDETIPRQCGDSVEVQVPVGFPISQRMTILRGRPPVEAVNVRHVGSHRIQPGAIFLRRSAVGRLPECADIRMIDGPKQIERRIQRIGQSLAVIVVGDGDALRRRQISYPARLRNNAGAAGSVYL